MLPGKTIWKTAGAFQNTHTVGAAALNYFVVPFPHAIADNIPQEKRAIRTKKSPSPIPQ